MGDNFINVNLSTSANRTNAPLDLYEVSMSILYRLDLLNS